MKGEPMYAKSAPAACAASTDEPVAIAPESASGPSNHERISCTSGKGDSVPAWPPAPVATAIRPSAPFSMAFLANLLLITSCSVIPPYECTAALTLSWAPSDVMINGTSCLTQTSRSCCSRVLDLCTIWLTAKGAALRSCVASCSASALLICTIHSSSFSCGLALSAGNEPTMPALHCAITSAGLDTMKSGAPMIGKRSLEAMRSVMALLDMQLMGAAALMLVENPLMKSPSLGDPVQRERSCENPCSSQNLKFDAGRRCNQAAMSAPRLKAPPSVWWAECCVFS